MYWKDALEQMMLGNPVKLPSWAGYWKYDKDKETVLMYTKDGEVLDIRETQRVYYTLSNIASDKWEIATEHNCTLMGGVPKITFTDAIDYIRRGFSLRCLDTMGSGEYIKLTSKGVFRFKEFKEGYLTSKVVISSKEWAPTLEEMNSKEWIFVD